MSPPQLLQPPNHPEPVGGLAVSRMHLAEDPLGQVPFRNERWRGLARRGVMRQFRRGHRLIIEGEQGDTLYILLSGSVRVFTAGGRGREYTFRVCSAGDHVGELSLDGGRRSATVETLEPTVCAEVTRETVRRYVMEFPEFAFDLLASVALVARLATASARQLALFDAYARLVQVLHEVSEPSPDGGVARLRERMTHAEIARRIGSTRPMVSKLLKALRAGGYVDVDEDGCLRLLRSLPPRF